MFVKKNQKRDDFYIKKIKKEIHKYFLNSQENEWDYDVIAMAVKALYFLKERKKSIDLRNIKDIIPAIIYFDSSVKLDKIGVL